MNFKNYISAAICYPLAFVAALSFAGCAAVTKDIQGATDFLASPTTTQAATNLKTIAQAFDCGIVVSGAVLAQNIEAAVNAGQAAIGTTGKVYAVSAAICPALGGTPSAAPVPVV